MTCEGCKYKTQKITFLGFKSFCRLYKKIRDLRCIDWRAK